MIRAEHLVVHYGYRPILDDLSLEIASGELVAVMGPNGTGKSTLLATLAGVHSPIEGAVYINGRKRKESEEIEYAIRREVFYLPDRPWLPTRRTPRQYLVDVARIYEVKDRRIFDHLDRLLDLFQLIPKADSLIADLSAGQQKKVAVAAALISDAPILILDEPFSGGLDPSALMALRRVLQQLAQRTDVTVLISAPVPELIDGLANRVAVLDNGRIVAYDTIENLRTKTGVDGTLETILEKLLQTKTADHVAKYFEGEAT